MIDVKEFTNPYENSIKKPEIIESNYKISRRDYQSLFADIATFLLSTFIR